MALSNYAFIWALYVWVPALDVYISGSQGAVDQRPLGNGDYYLLLPLSLLCALRPTSRLLTLAHVVKLVLFALRMPFVWDHECWAALNEAALVATYLTRGSFESFFAAARSQIIVLYSSAAFWKLNTSFLSPQTSCATVILIQQLSAYAPSNLAALAAPAIAAAAPTTAFLVEALIPMLLAFAPRYGVALALLFHAFF